MKNKDIEDILYINYIFVNLLTKENYNLIEKFLKTYNLDFKLLDTIIKINKLNQIKINNIQKRKNI